jgi:prolyl oligopeptidase
LDDVAAVAEDLVRSGFTTPERLGLTGRSYGGLMAAAVAVRRPDLFAAVLDGVPVTDLFPAKNSVGQLSTLKGALGDPDDPEDRAVMLSYSPLQNIRQGVHYPRILTVCSTSDDRVGPGPARRFTAKLEAMGLNPLLMEGPTGGHLFPKASTDPDAVTAEAMFFIETLMR